jgi:hypothetical protein
LATGIPHLVFLYIAVQYQPQTDLYIAGRNRFAAMRQKPVHACMASNIQFESHPRMLVFNNNLREDKNDDHQLQDPAASMWPILLP